MCLIINLFVFCTFSIYYFRVHTSTFIFNRRSRSRMARIARCYQTFCNNYISVNVEKIFPTFELFLGSMNDNTNEINNQVISILIMLVIEKREY